ncbi:hypothetical protein HmCmsJML204_01070 [Escherichia coli]|nr:hypothetical protein HmCmsJML204_01070 [Escherichia coli]
MDDAELNMRLRVHAIYRFREAFQAVHAGNQDVLKATIFQLSQYTQPELCTFIFCQPHTQQLFLTVGIDAQREEHRFVNDTPAVTNLNHNTVKINNGIQCIQRSILPFRDLLFNRIGHFGYQRGRDIGVVHFFERGNDFPRSHAFGIQGQNLAVHLGDAS